MKKQLSKTYLSAIMITVTAISVASAQSETERIEILEHRLEELSRKVEEGGSVHGGNAVRFHGYGELHYGNRSGGDDKLDFHRLVIGVGYDLAENILLDFEIDFEHAATELELEFAQVSFLFSDEVNARAGSMLMPVGYLNHEHEPVLFYSVERPYVQKNVIPTTWSEAGVGLFGSLREAFRYHLYVVGGLDAGGFSGSSGIRGGRGKVAESLANDLAVVGRADWALPGGFDAGFSGYLGDAGQDNPDLDSSTVSILEADLRYRRGPFEFTALVADVDVSDTEKINMLTDDVIGESIFGWYVEGACMVGESFLPEDQDLALFVRHEQFNTQDEVAPGFDADPANDREVTTFGLAYFPVEQLAIKADVESWSDGTGADWTQVNGGLAFVY